MWFRLFSAAWLAACCLTPAAHAAPDWSGGVATPVPTSMTAPVAPGVIRADARYMVDAQWEQVEGCAKSIAAGGVNQVLVVGCGSQGAAGAVFEWKNGRFVPEPEQSVMQIVEPDGTLFFKVSARFAPQARWLAIDGVTGKVYAIGPDATVYSRPWASPYAYHQWTQFVGAERYAKPAQMTAIAAGGGRSGGDLWAISAQPEGAGGNKIYTSEPCPSLDRIGAGRCWKGVNGAAQKVALGNAIWVTSADGGIFRREGNGWARVEGCARDIAAHGEHVYVVGCDWNTGEGTVYRWHNNQWVNTRQRAKTLAVDVAGTPWLVKASGQIYRRKAVTPAPIR